MYKNKTWSVRYEQNQIPYTEEVTSTFEVLDLVNRAPEGLWKEVQNIVQKAENKTMPKGEKNASKKKCGCLRRSYK